VLRSLVLVVVATLAALALSVAGASGGRATPSSFPVTVLASNGKVTVQKRPARIVSLSPTATESLFAIGAGPQVVAVDDQSDYPKIAPTTALSGFTPNVEAIAAYKPDLVVIAYDPKASGFVAEERLPSQRRDRPGFAPGSLTVLSIAGEPIIGRCAARSSGTGCPSSPGRRLSSPSRPFPTSERGSGAGISYCGRWRTRPSTRSSERFSFARPET
jgi:hypothetical protein